LYFAVVCDPRFLLRDFLPYPREKGKRNGRSAFVEGVVLLPAGRGSLDGRDVRA
jgi:hypothetical protein